MESHTENKAFSDLTRTLKYLHPELLRTPLLKKISQSASPAFETSNTSSLHAYQEKIQNCINCSMHIGREKLVFGRGPEKTKFIFVGDFPSSIEDSSGQAFDGDVGDLLRKMIIAMRLQPEHIYLTHLLKCRAPSGYKPQREDFIACEKHLQTQLQQLEAEYVIALGELSAQWLARSHISLAQLRKQEHHYGNARLFCTHHPRDLLAHPSLKKETWGDLQIVMKVAGL